MIPVFIRTLVESWRGLLVWTLALTAVMMLYLSLYPSIGIDGQMMQMRQQQQLAMQNASQQIDNQNNMETQ